MSGTSRAALLLGCAFAACRAQDAGGGGPSAHVSAQAGTRAAPPPPDPPRSASETVATPIPAPIRRFAFDDDAPRSPPSGFLFARTGAGRDGTWIVEADPTAPSAPNVLAQRNDDPTDGRYAIALPAATDLKDVDLNVRCKPLTGKVDQACGLVLRYQNSNTYYLARANALEKNVRFYVVMKGERKQLASADHPVTAGAWHTLRVVAQGPRFEVHWDGAKSFELEDRALAGAGKVGVWTKADSVTLFDDLKSVPLL